MGVSRWLGEREKLGITRAIAPQVHDFSRLFDGCLLVFFGTDPGYFERSIVLQGQEIYIYEEGN